MFATAGFGQSNYSTPTPFANLDGPTLMEGTVSSNSDVSSLISSILTPTTIDSKQGSNTTHVCSRKKPKK